MNIDKRTVEAFGGEWTRFNQNELDEAERLVLFDSYFRIFPWHRLRDEPEGFDMGCGSGRWARLVAPKVACLNCIDPSLQALDVACGNLAVLNNVVFLNASVSDCPIASGTAAYEAIYADVLGDQDNVKEAA